MMTVKNSHYWVVVALEYTSHEPLAIFTDEASAIRWIERATGEEGERLQTEQAEQIKAWREGQPLPPHVTSIWEEDVDVVSIRRGYGWTGRIIFPDGVTAPLSACYKWEVEQGWLLIAEGPLPLLGEL